MLFFIWKKGLFFLKKWKKGCYLHLHQEQELNGEDASDRGAVAQPQRSKLVPFHGKHLIHPRGVLFRLALAGSERASCRRRISMVSVQVLYYIGFGLV
jgi:hypothetical protein